MREDPVPQKENYHYRKLTYFMNSFLKFEFPIWLDFSMELSFCITVERNKEGEASRGWGTLLHLFLQNIEFLGPSMTDSAQNWSSHTTCILAKN